MKPGGLVLLLAMAACAQVRYTEIVAHIVLEDGSPMTTSPLIVVEPGSGCSAQSFLGGTVRLRVPYVLTGNNDLYCPVTVRLTGYRAFTGPVRDGAQIKLFRLGPHEDDTVSKAGVSIPVEARRLYESGESLASRKKWTEAEERFRAAVAQYPGYAVAWSELGRALQQQGRLEEAVAALNQARDTDRGYMKPLVQLAEIAGLQRRWKDELELSRQALALHPAGFTAAWFECAQAAYELGFVEEAEKLARESVRLDRDVQSPEAMVLLGRIFEKRGNAADAVVEYKAYLKAAPRGAEAEFARQAVVRLK